MAILKMTKEEYKAKYGQAPGLSAITEQPAEKTGLGGTIKNAFKSGMEYSKQGYEEAVNAKNPVQLLEGSLKFASGGIGAAFSPLAPVMKPVEKAVNYAGEKIADIAEPISDIPAVQKFAGTKLGGAIVSGGERLAEDVGNVANIAGAIAGTGQIPKVAGKAVSIPTKTVGGSLKSLGEKAYGLTVVPEKSTAHALMTYEASKPTLAGRIKNIFTGSEAETAMKPTTEAQTAAKYGLAGTEWKLGVQAKRATNNLWQSVIEPKLAQVKGAVNMKNFLSEVEKDIRKSGGDLTRRNNLLEALNAVKADYTKVGKVNLSKLQQYKEGWAEFLPDATYAGKPIASGLKEVHNLMADKARQLIYKYVGPEGKQAYIDYGNLQSIIKAGEKSIIGDPATRSISRNVWQFVMDKAVTPIATYAGKILYKTGEGLEFIGNKGAKTVGDVIGEKPIKAGVKKYQETPNKEGGFANFGFGKEIRRTAGGDILPSENMKALLKQSDGLSDFITKVERSVDGNRLTRKEIETIYDNFTGGIKANGK